MTQSDARWSSAEVLARQFAVDEPMLLRFARRGMVGAEWDEHTQRWLYDAERVSALFLPRGTSATTGMPHLGVLGAVTLGVSRKRKPRVQSPPVGEKSASRTTRSA
jgi:hypothetical protein